MNSPSRLAMAALALLLGSGALPGCDGSSEPPWSPESADLVFTSNRDGDSDIYLLEAGASEWKNLTANDASDNWPRWSPDGTKIAFQRRGEDGLDVWVMNADGTGQTRLTDHPAHDYVPSWSPDGSRISFASWRMEDADSLASVHIYVMNADGSDQRRFLEESPEVSGALEWSPDGKWFALTRRLVDEPAEVYLLDDRGEMHTRVTRDEAFNGSAVFSPDGRRLAYYADRDSTSALKISALDGADVRTVVDGGQAWYPRWSPDGQWLVYTVMAGDGDLDVHAIRSDGMGDPVPLVTGPYRESEGEWRPSTR